MAIGEVPVVGTANDVLGLTDQVADEDTVVAH